MTKEEGQVVNYKYSITALRTSATPDFEGSLPMHYRVSKMCRVQLGR